MNDSLDATVCGLSCSRCQFVNSQCHGCNAVKGKPFWTDRIPGNICPIFNCCRYEKLLEHCGLCEAFPCELFMSLRDPQMSDGEFEESIQDRQKVLILRRKTGTSHRLEHT